MANPRKLFVISAKNRVGQYLRKNFSTFQTKNWFSETRQILPFGQCGARPRHIAHLPWLIQFRPSLGQLAKATPRGISIISGYFHNFWVFPILFGNYFLAYSPSYLIPLFLLFSIIHLIIISPKRIFPLKPFFSKLHWWKLGAQVEEI